MVLSSVSVSITGAKRASQCGAARLSGFSRRGLPWGLCCKLGVKRNQPESGWKQCKLCYNKMIASFKVIIMASVGLFCLVVCSGVWPNVAV